MSNLQASNRPTRPLYSKSKIGSVTTIENNESSAAKDGDDEETADFVEDTVCSGDSVSRVGESQSLLDNADDDDELFDNSSQNISTASDDDILTTDNEVSNSEKLEVDGKMSESELMMQPTQAPITKLPSNHMDDKTQAASKLSESELMGASTQAMSTSKLLSESQLMGLPTQAVMSMSESQLMGLQTQAVMNSMSESQLYATDTQSASLSKLSESEIMGLPTQALVSGMSESQLYATDTQAVSASSKLSESELMFASTQAVSASFKLSESELMFASTQAVNKSSRISDSLLMSAETQNISKFSDSQLMSANTKAPASSPVVNKSKNTTEELSESNLMMAPTQFIQHEDKTSVYDQETCPVDVDVTKETENEKDIDETEEAFDKDHDSEDLLNADTQSLTSQNAESAEIMLLKTQSIEKESEELLPSSNEKIESSPNLFDAEPDDLLDDFEIETPPSTANNFKDVPKDGEENQDDVDSDSEMIIESSQDVVQCNRSRLINKTASSQLTLVPPSQDELSEEEIRNPVEDGSDVSETGSENLMDDLEDGDLTDDDLQALFDKQHPGSQNSELSTQTTSQTTSIQAGSQNKGSQQLDHPTPSDSQEQERPSSEVIPASQVEEPAVARLARTTTNYSIKSMEETNLDYQSSQESDVGFKQTLSGLIDNLNVTTDEIEETLVEQNERTVIKNKNTHVTTSLPTSMIETPIKTPKRQFMMEKGEEEITSPIIARNQSSQSLKGLNNSANSSNHSSKKITNISSLVDLDPESDSESLIDMPDIDQETPNINTADNNEELEIGPSTIDNDKIQQSKEKALVAESSEAENELAVVKTPQRKTVLKLSEIVLKTPVEARLCGEASKAQDSPIRRPESGPFLPDTLVS